MIESEEEIEARKDGIPPGTACICNTKSGGLSLVRIVGWAGRYRCTSLRKVDGSLSPLDAASVYGQKAQVLSGAAMGRVVIVELNRIRPATLDDDMQHAGQFGKSQQF